MGSGQVLLYRRHGNPAGLNDNYRDWTKTNLITMGKGITYTNKSYKSEEISGMKEEIFLNFLEVVYSFSSSPGILLSFLIYRHNNAGLCQQNSMLSSRSAEDGLVNCYTGRSNWDTGAITSLVQIMADELESH